MSGAKLFKKIARPFYNLLSQKLANDLKIQQTQEMLLQINHRAFTLEQELSRLKTIQSMTNIIVSGVDSFSNSLYQKYPEASLETLDLIEIINGQRMSATDIVSYFDKIDLDLHDKAVTIIGGGDELFTHTAERKGAKKVVRIEGTSKLSAINDVGEVRFIYPLDLSKTKIDHTDVLMLPNPSWAVILINRNLAGIGAFVKKNIVISVRVKGNTVFKSDLEPAIFEDDGRISLNDNYVRKQLHINGFVEVKCVYTEGEHIDNRFDCKITKFNHLKGFTVTKKNIKYRNDKKYNNETTTGKIYIGYKLPQNKYAL